MITRALRKKRLEFWKIAPQSFPASVAESNALFAGTVEAGWACQDTATGLLSFSGVAAQTLVSSGGAGIVMGQPAVGLFDGASFKAQKAAEFQPLKGGANRYACAAGATFDRDWTSPWSELIVFRTSALASGYRGIQMKGTYAGPGWGFFFGTTGVLYATVSDGAGNIVSLNTALSSYADGAWHWAYARWNPTDDTLKLDTDLETGLSISTATITTTAAAAATFGFGDWDATSAFEGQIRGCILFSDVATTVASIQAWWKHGAVPAPITSYTRASSFSSIVADDATTGDVVRTVAAGQYAVGYNALISTNALKLGMCRARAATNLLPDTNVNLTAVWVNTTAAAGTTALYNADSPRGFREAVLHTKTAAGDMNLCAAAKGAAVTSGAVYTASIWCAWAGASTAPELHVYRADGTTLIGSVAATNATGLRRRLSYTFTAPATETVRVAFMGAGAAAIAGSAWFSCPMVNTETWAKTWVQTTGATASTVAIYAYKIIPRLSSDYGTIKIWCALEGAPTDITKAVLQASQTSGGSLTNERLLYIATTTRYLSMYAAGAGEAVTAGQSDWTSIETIAIGSWDDSARYGETVRVARMPGSLTGAIATALPAVTQNPYLFLGSRGPTAEAIDGLISQVDVWTGVEKQA